MNVAELKKVVVESVQELLMHHVSDIKIEKSKLKHENKIHFIPAGYRVMGGVIQALNISFGNFIEILLKKILEDEKIHTVLPECGGRIKAGYALRSAEIIDAYMTKRVQTDAKVDDPESFSEIIQQIIAAENDENAVMVVETKDVDLLFRTPEGKLVYVEVKYNDDHDTGKFDDIYRKFDDIYRKFLKTIAVIVRQYKITSPDQLECYVYYFNPAKRYQAVYLPEKFTFRGEALFKQFMTTNFKELDTILRDISESPEVIAIFNKLNKTTTGIE